MVTRNNSLAILFYLGICYTLLFCACTESRPNDLSNCKLNISISHMDWNYLHIDSANIQCFISFEIMYTNNADSTITIQYDTFKIEVDDFYVYEICDDICLSNGTDEIPIGTNGRGIKSCQIERNESIKRFVYIPNYYLWKNQSFLESTKTEKAISKYIDSIVRDYHLEITHNGHTHNVGVKGAEIRHLEE